MKDFTKLLLYTLLIFIVLLFSTQPLLEDRAGEGIEFSALYRMNDTSLFTLNHPIFMFLVFTMIAIIFLTSKSLRLVHIGKGLYAIGFLGFSLNVYQFHQQLSNTFGHSNVSLSGSGMIVITVLLIGTFSSLYLLFHQHYVSFVHSLKGRSYTLNSFYGLNNPFELLKEWHDLVEVGALTKTEYGHLKDSAIEALVEVKKSPIVKIELLKMAHKENLISEEDVELSKMKVLKSMNIISE